MHGPVAGKLWMRLANIHPTGKEKFSDMYGKMFWNLIVNVVTAYGLAVFILLASSSPYVPGSSVAGGLICAFIVWLSFLVASSSIDVIWMGRSSSLWLFECFSSFLVMLSMGAIIALMH
jgi:energy-converting hydrogenase Eha subunit B